MRTKLCWIDGTWLGRLAVMSRPRGGEWLEDEVLSWNRAGVNVVVSLLTPGEVNEFSLGEEEMQCLANGIHFLSFPIPDRGVPASTEKFLDLVTKTAEFLVAGKFVVIHCRQGIGRAPMIAICQLIHAGMEPAAAIEKVSLACGRSVPETVEQKKWIAEFENSLVLPSRTR